MQVKASLKAGAAAVVKHLRAYNNAVYAPLVAASALGYDADSTGAAKAQVERAAKRVAGVYINLAAATGVRMETKQPVSRGGRAVQPTPAAAAQQVLLLPADEDVRIRDAL